MIARNGSIVVVGIVSALLVGCSSPPDRTENINSTSQAAKIAPIDAAILQCNSWAQGQAQHCYDHCGQTGDCSPCNQENDAAFAHCMDNTGCGTGICR